MRSASSTAPWASSATRVLVSILAALAVLTALLSMHAFDGEQPVASTEVGVVHAAPGHAEQFEPIAALTDSAVVDSARALGLIGCAALGTLCALGAITVMKRAGSTSPPLSRIGGTAPFRLEPMRATRHVASEAPSLFSLSILRT